MTAEQGHAREWSGTALTLPSAMQEVTVLILTQNAAAMINRLTAQAALPAGAGLRIAQRRDRPSLAMEMAAAPQPFDAVLRDRDVVVFLDPPAAARLAGQVLDARTDDRGSAFFLDA